MSTPIKYLSAALIFVAVAFTSCKKEHTCSCKTKQNTGSYSQNVTTNVKTKKISKADAKEYCNSLDVKQNVSTQGSSISQEVDCELK